MASNNIQNSRRENASTGLHRRNSSVWKPETGILYNPIEILRSKSTRVKGSRTIPPNHLEEVKRYNLPNYRHFADNSVSTTTYKLFDSPLGIFYAIPRNLVHQFVTKWANWVFLLVAVINFFPQVAAYNKYVALFPPAFVLTTTMLKDFYEDYRRYRSDREVNSKTCKVWDSEKRCFRKTKWKRMLVGDIVRVANDGDIPADILFLRSSDEHGVCYVETSNLDGETSLKQRNVPKRYLDWSKTAYSLVDDTVANKFTATILCEKPDRAIYTVNARLKYGPEEGGVCDVITKENMLLRGSKLKNTDWVEGCIMYAGPDTKVMVNNDGARHKTSGIEKLTNRFILACCIMLLLMVFSGGILCAVFQDEKGTVNVTVEEKKKNEYVLVNKMAPNVPYIPINIWKPAVSGLFDVLTLVICYQVIVPISLYITIDIIKMFQIKFINMDIDLYDEETDHRIDCRTWNIPEDLGQITHILSDKTGTLTENKMVFRKCAIDDIDYGGEFDPDSLDKFQAVASRALTERIAENWLTDEGLSHFMKCIVLNNTVIVNKKRRQDVMDIGAYDPVDRVYTISNSAFYDFSAAEFQRMQDEVLPTPVRQEDNRFSWGPLSNIPEDSETVVSLPNSPSYSVVQAPPAPTESSIVRKSSRVSSLANAAWRTVKRPISFIFYPAEDEVPLRMRTATIMEGEQCPYEAESPDELALLQGALLYGYRLEARSMNHVVYEQPDETTKNVKILLMLPFDSIRKRMSVIVETSKGPLMYTKGADSSILNRLDPEASVHKSDIENMVNKYSCQGLRTLCFAMKQLTDEEFKDFANSYEFVRSTPTVTDKEEMLSKKADEIEKDLTLLGVTGIEDRLQDGVCETVSSLREAGIQIWVLTGDKLETAENIARSSGLFEENMPIYTINCEEDFNQVKKIDEEKAFNLILSPDVVKTMKESEEVVAILKRTKCVLCYRMAPAQKAEVVHYVKKKLKARSLAIGDGANDVPMIQEAHIGIGVKGKEGMQAVMSSDFAIARFKFLKKLLLVHGHWSYYRSALIFLYFLYKNANCVFILFYYQFFDGYSGAYSEDPTYSVLYPIIFTRPAGTSTQQTDRVQPIVVGVLDQDYEAHELMKKPHLYRAGREGTSYTYTLFFLNMLDAMWQAAIVYFFTHLSLLGNTDGLWYFGFYLATGMMFVNTFHLMLEVRYWTHILTVVFASFFVLHFAFFAVWCLIAPTGSVKDLPTEVFNTATSNINFWLCLFSITIVALLPRYLLRVLHNSGLTFSVLNK